MVDFYRKKNGRPVQVMYPTRGTSNVLRRVDGVKLRSGTGPSGRYIVVQESNGQIRSLSLKKIVQMN